MVNKIPSVTSIGQIVEKYFILIVRETVRVVVIILWSVIGFLCWIPLLTRMVFFFTSNVVFSAFTGSDLIRAQQGLDSAIKFYALGFNKINQAISNEIPEGKIVEKIGFKFLMKIIPDILFTIFFWFIITFITGLITIDLSGLYDTFNSMQDAWKSIP